MNSLTYKELAALLAGLSPEELEQEVLVDAIDNKYGRSIFAGLKGIDRMTKADEIYGPKCKKGQVYLT